MGARIVAIGGCGGMGRHAVRTALALGGIDELVVADLDRNAAKRFAQTCDSRVRGVGVSADNPRALADLFGPADAVLNTVGPFFRFGVPVLRAAVAAGCHYLDICDDWEPTLEMLELDAQARAAGVTAVVGTGASPGISNLLAVLALRELDSVDELHTGWSLEDDISDDRRPRRPSKSAPASAAAIHAIHQLTGSIRVRRAGRFVEERPLREVDLRCPGAPLRSGVTIGHPEALTLPRLKPELRECTNVMLGAPADLRVIRWLTRAVNFRLLSVGSAARMLERLAVAGSQRAAPARRTPRNPPIFALARGLRGGQPAAVVAMIRALPAGGMGGATGVPLAVGLRLLLSAGATRSGVLTPEEAFDPDAFFATLSPHCIGDADPVQIVRSWQADGEEPVN